MRLKKNLFYELLRLVFKQIAYLYNQAIGSIFLFQLCLFQLINRFFSSSPIFGTGKKYTQLLYQAKFPKIQILRHCLNAYVAQWQSSGIVNRRLSVRFRPQALNKHNHVKITSKKSFTKKGCTEYSSCSLWNYCRSSFTLYIRVPTFNKLQHTDRKT